MEFHTETVEIKLTAQKENGIISFCFSNNYAELKPVELENLKRKFTEDYRPNETEVKSLGIGLYNVYRRLKLMYGNNVELQVHYENHMFMLIIILNYISLFSYLFISYQMSAKPYFIGSTGIFTFCSRSHIGVYLLMFSLSNVVNFVVNTSMLSDALSLFWHSQ